MGRRGVGARLGVRPARGRRASRSAGGAVAVTLVLVPADRARQQRQDEQGGERAAYAHGLASRRRGWRERTPPARSPRRPQHPIWGSNSRRDSPSLCASAVLGHGSDVLGKEGLHESWPCTPRSRGRLRPAAPARRLLRSRAHAGDAGSDDLVAHRPSETETGPVEPTLPPEAEGDGVEAAEAFVTLLLRDCSTTRRRRAIPTAFASWQLATCDACNGGRGRHRPRLRERAARSRAATTRSSRSKVTGSRRVPGDGGASTTWPCRRRAHRPGRDQESEDLDGTTPAGTQRLRYECCRQSRRMADRPSGRASDADSCDRSAHRPLLVVRSSYRLTRSAASGSRSRRPRAGRNRPRHGHLRSRGSSNGRATRPGAGGSRHGRPSALLAPARRLPPGTGCSPSRMRHRRQHLAASQSYSCADGSPPVVVDVCPRQPAASVGAVHAMPRGSAAHRGHDPDRDRRHPRRGTERPSRKSTLPESTINVQPPGGETLVNLPTILSTSAERHQIPVHLGRVNIDVLLEVWPSSFVWHHGDGTSQSTTTPGKRVDRGRRHGRPHHPHLRQDLRRASSSASTPPGPRSSRSSASRTGARSTAP